MHVLFVHSIEISISQTRKMILESSGRIRETSDFSAYAFGLFAAAIPLAQMILEKKNTLHRKETVEKLVQQMSSSSMNMEWFSRSVRDGTSVSVTSLSMSKLIGLVITASSKTSFSSLRDKFRYMEKIFVNELLEIEKNRDDMEKTWRGILEIDLSDKVLFEAVLETLRRRAKVVCWREIFMISDFEIVRDLNSTDVEREEAQNKLNALPRDSSSSRKRNRCAITGRPHGVYRKLKISRIALRDLGLHGLIPGMTKSSW